ncbi:unnamed protein product [Ostreobium quekettii]|uniref:BTB domain-containing protein n=1 Tax=Ostreobium quekettii TaxID=121088 RepID=A0A8S1ILF2_9CHLO|nr:unnamed protein product [Ostreobium quekettii]|eukprot:evm.model.scf_3222.1 EVM.evm.TU.scf_3222.1   scf_3222:4360-6498(-)
MVERVFSLADYASAQFKALLDGGDYTDITLLVSVAGEDGKFVIDPVKSHKLVLGAWSPVLRSMMEKAARDGHPNWVRLTGYEPAALKGMIETFYTGKFTLTVDRVWATRKVAVQLDVQPVVKQCDTYLQSNITMDTCIEWVMLARENGADDFANQCLAMMGRCFNALREQDAFLAMDSQLLLQLLDSHQLQAVSEYSVLTAALRWVNHDPGNRQELIPEISKRIRFHLMSAEDKRKLLNGTHSAKDLPREAREKFNEVVKSNLKTSSLREINVPRNGVLRRGIVVDMPIDEIREVGWKLVYGQPYMSHTSVKDLENIEGDYLMVAASRKGERKIKLCAMGRRDKILTQTRGNEVTFENGTFWYYCPDRAFGFAPNAHIDLNIADTVDEDGDKRLSWHLHERRDSSGDAGGFRAGMLKNINEETQWVKLVFSLKAE